MNNHTLKISIFSAFVLLGVVAKSAPADQGNLGNPGIVPPHSSFRGLTYSEWSVEWFKWAYSLPLADHPLNDTADCSVGQTGDVWFLDGPFYGKVYPPQGRDCTIPPGTALFLTLKAASWDNEGCSSLNPPSVIQRTDYTEDTLRSFAQRDLINGYGVRKIIIDGVEIKGLPAACVPTDPKSCQSPYRVQSPVFDYTVPALDNTLIFFNGACYNDPNKNGKPYTVPGVVADGYYVMIKPLPIGSHTIRFGQLDSITGTPIRLYTITVSVDEHEHEHEHGKKGFH